ncbi:ATP-dependent zinc metalloprotease ftsh 2 chloroplastic [Phtheirospermum japonicum]|uniref:ATP-dependent zinc metalloprotease ftsh 2 chloroplastic n=1 Tax=Phtheirospermum japonicum TaxID=374723 RepID=A0A830CFG6_9LAMI|nr:ATP-dependent zinc metalloprotease ftsh 2 chloroplastic [Phtheirospermum japonicum]
MPTPSATSSKKTKSSGQNHSVPHCVVEGCTFDLSKSKVYHRKHRVCDDHSKSPKVVVGGLERQFCQQCSRNSSDATWHDSKFTLTKGYPLRSSGDRGGINEPMHIPGIKLPYAVNMHGGNGQLWTSKSSVPEVLYLSHKWQIIFLSYCCSNLKFLLGNAELAVSTLLNNERALADDQGISNSRMSYSRFLEYLDKDRVKKVVLFENGTIAIVEAISPELGNRVQRVRVIGSLALASIFSDGRVQLISFSVQKSAQQSPPPLRLHHGGVSANGISDSSGTRVSLGGSPPSSASTWWHDSSAATGLRARGCAGGDSGGSRAVGLAKLGLVVVVAIRALEKRSRVWKLGGRDGLVSGWLGWR